MILLAHNGSRKCADVESITYGYFRGELALVRRRPGASPLFLRYDPDEGRGGMIRRRRRAPSA
jgi:hypothetical protein